MAEQPIRLDAILVKEETTYGTDPTPAVGADEIRLSERIWAQMTPEHVFPNLREESAAGSLLPLAPGAKRGSIMTLEFGIELTGNGAAYADATPGPAVYPPVDPLLVSCGMSRTIDETVSSEKATYTPADSGHLSCTIWAYSGGNLYKINGCRGNLIWPLDPGVLGTLRFRMQGIWASTATASLPSTTYNAQIPQAVVGLSLAVSGWSPTRVSGEFDLGAEVVQRPSVNATDGIQGFSISGFEPRFRLTAETDALATQDPYTIAKPASAAVPTNQTIDLTLGATQYNRANLDVNNATIATAPQHVDLDGFTGWELEYRLTTVSVVFD